MPPIPVYTNTPISAAINPPATTTTYPQALPGAPPVPAPTGSATTPSLPKPIPAPTATTDLPPNDGPPAPQPGAVPVPAIQRLGRAQRAPIPSGSTDLAPTRSAAEAALPNITQMPAQFSIPAPSSNYAPTHSTTTAAAAAPGYPSTTAAHPLPVSLPQPPRPSPYETGRGHADAGAAGEDDRRPSLDHPPGYQQNPFAADMTPSQRAAQEQMESRETIGGGLPALSGGSGDGTGVWDQAKGWLEKVGSGLSEVEKDVWRRFGGSDKGM